MNSKKHTIRGKFIVFLLGFIMLVGVIMRIPRREGKDASHHTQSLRHSDSYRLLPDTRIAISIPKMMKQDEFSWGKKWELEYCKPGNLAVLVDHLSFIQEGEPGRFDTQGKGVPVSFGGAAFYYLSNASKQYEEFYHLIEGTGADSIPNILKFTLGQRMSGDLGTPIIHVEALPKAEVQAWRQRYKESWRIK